MKNLLKVIMCVLLSLTIFCPVQVLGAASPDASSVQAPAKVQSVKVHKNEYNRLRISWDEVDHAEYYQVYRSKSGKPGSFILKRQTESLSYTNIGVTCGKTYYYKVRAVNAAGKGEFSEVYSNRAQPAVPAIEVSLGGSDKSPYTRKPVISWSLVKGANGYQVFRSVEGQNLWKKVADTTKSSFLDSTKSGFSVYKNYDYKVRAYRLIKGKKVYGYFSKIKFYTPDWNIEDLMPQLISYGESIEGQRMEYLGIPGEFGIYTGAEGSKYTFSHSFTDAGEIRTPENSSWTAEFPIVIQRYWSKETVLKELKNSIDCAIKMEIEMNPLTYIPADGNVPAYWSGTDSFTLYARPEENTQLFWVMF